MILKTEKSITLTLDPKEVEKKYSIDIGSTFEPYSGNNLKVFVQEIRKIESSSEISQRQMAKEIAKELGYENYKRVSIDINCGGYWENSEDGFSGHDILRTYIYTIVLNIILKE